MRPPIKWYGSKIRLAQQIVRLLSEHRIYVEVFGGSAAILCTKVPAPVEYYNDLDGDVVHFYRMLRDRGPELRDKLLLTPYARAEHQAARRNYADVDDPMERARLFFLLVMESMNGQMGRSWSRGRTHSAAAKFGSAVDRLPAAIQRLRDVQIENQDFRRLMPALDAPDTLFYCDPPYVHGTRRTPKAYRYEMTDEAHREFLDIATTVQGHVVISGYRHPLYDAALVGWERHDFPVRRYAAVLVRSTKAVVRSRTVECIWRNPRCVAHSDSNGWNAR